MKHASGGANFLDAIKELQKHENNHIFSHASLAAMPSMGEFAIIDVGANDGEIALTFAGLFPKARIYAVEADPKTYQRLAGRVAQTPAIQPVNMAIHSQPGTINFHSNKLSHMSSIHDLPDTRASATLIQIEAKTLDGLVEDLRIENVGVLKVDTEGNDLEVLKGADKLLHSPSLQYVICEFGIDPACQRHIPLNRFLDFLAQRGFHLATTGNFGISVMYLHGNALFARKGISEAR